MKVLITGGAGYVGIPLINALAAVSSIDEILIYDNLSRGNYSLFTDTTLQSNVKLTFTQADILDTRSLALAMLGVDVVFHLAACVTTPNSQLDPHVFEQVNHWGTAEVVSAFEKSGATRLIYVSSTSIYGDTELPADESTRPNPRTFYCSSKLRGEQHVMRLLDKGQAVIIRLANVYGYATSMRYDSVINRFAFESKFKRRISIHGTGKQTRAYIHINDAAHVLCELSDYRIPCAIYNLGVNNFSVLEVVDGFKEAVPELEFNFVDQYFELHSFRLDTDLELEKHISLTQRRTFSSEITSLLDRFSF